MRPTPQRLRRPAGVALLLAALLVVPMGAVAPWGIDEGGYPWTNDDWTTIAPQEDNIEPGDVEDFQPPRREVQDPLVWVHGYASGFVQGHDVIGYWRSMDDALRPFFPNQYYVAWYTCDRWAEDDDRVVIDIAKHPNVPSRHANPPGAAHHDYMRVGFDCLDKPLLFDEPYGHSEDTHLEHVAYHFAWSLYENFPNRCVRIIAHSMGGIVVRHALMKSEARDPYFPPLCVLAAYTMGTPHGGFPHVPDSFLGRQAAQIDDDHAFMRELKTDRFPNPNENLNPPRGDTLWTAMVARDDEVLVGQTQIGTDINGWARIFGGNHDYGHSDHMDDPVIASDRDYEYAPPSWVGVPEAGGRGGGLRPVPLAHMSLLFLRWGCGRSFGDPQPIDLEYVWVGRPVDARFDACRYTLDVPEGQGSMHVKVNAPGTSKSIRIYRITSIVPTAWTLQKECIGGLSDNGVTWCTLPNPVAGTYFIEIPLTPDDIGNRYLALSAHLSLVRPPDPPVSAAAHPLTDGVRVTWAAAPQDGGEATQRYCVYRDGIRVNPCLNAATFSWKDAMLATDTAYHVYQITAVNSAGESERSATARERQGTVPGAPGSANAELLADRNIRVTWSGSSSPTHPVTEQCVAIVEPFWHAWCGLSPSDRSFTHAIAYQHGYYHKYKVYAINKVGTGAATETNSVLRPGKSQEPRNFEATPGNGRVTLAWDPPAWDGGNAITKYCIMRYSGDGEDWVEFCPTVGQTQQAGGFHLYTDTGLANGVTYYYSLAPWNDYGYGVWWFGIDQNGEEYYEIPATPHAGIGAASSPQGVTTTNSTHQVTVLWAKPRYAGSQPIQRYCITDGTRTWCTPDATTLAYTITDLPDGIPIELRVAADNGAVGAYSRSVRDTPNQNDCDKRVDAGNATAPLAIPLGSACAGVLNQGGGQRDDEDWYVVDVTPGQWFTITLTPESLTRDFDLCIHPPGEAPTCDRGTGPKTWWWQSLSYAPHKLEVIRTSGFGGYTLTVA